MACGYLGVLLVGAVVYSIGLFVSSLCSSQVTAGIITFLVTFLLFIANILTAGVHEGSIWHPVVDAVGLNANYQDFLKGVVDTGRLVYLLSVTGFFLFLTVRTVESRRWR